jgi:RNA-directed DNA polymerase
VEKSAVARPWARKFLGFSFTSGIKPKRRIAPQALNRFRKRVRELTQWTRGIKLKEMIEELAVYLKGWRGYFAFSETPTVLYRLEMDKAAATLFCLEAVEDWAQTVCRT